MIATGLNGGGVGDAGGTQWSGSFREHMSRPRRTAAEVLPARCGPTMGKGS